MRARHRQRALVAVMAETRAWELTIESFDSNVLGVLDADLALCVGDHEEPNPLYERARYVWRAEEPDDWGELYDRKAGGPGWRVLLKPGGQLLGGIEGPGVEESGSGAIVLYYRQFLRESIERAGLIDDYDWLVVTRSDLIWPVPHPGTAVLSNRHIYALDGEQYGGVGDRHLIVPRRHIRRFLEVPEPIFSDPDRLRRGIERRSAAQGWPVLNPERFLASRLKDLGLWRHVRFLPYLPYAVRAPGGSTRWVGGVFDEQLGYYVKYPTELERSRIAQRLIRDQRSWARFLSPIRGFPMRRELRAEYRRGGLYERPFPLRETHRRAGRRLRASLIDRRDRLHPITVRAGRQLRRIPGMRRPLDARLGRIRRRAERRP